MFDFFFKPIRQQRWQPWPFIGWNIFSTPPLQLQTGICNHRMVCDEIWQPVSSQRLLPSLVFSGSIDQHTWPLWPPIDRDIFDFSATAVRNLRMLHNMYMYSSSSVPRVSILGRSVNKDCRLGLWFPDTFIIVEHWPCNISELNEELPLYECVFLDVHVQNCLSLDRTQEGKGGVKSSFKTLVFSFRPILLLCTCGLVVHVQVFYISFNLYTYSCGYLYSDSTHCFAQWSTVCINKSP